MYQPTLGRFTARDPMPENGVLVGGIPQSSYWYANNNPVNFVDPSGLQSKNPYSVAYPEGPGFVFPTTTDEPEFPAVPTFPEAGKEGKAFKNARTLLGINCLEYLSCPSRKDARQKPIPNIGPPPKPIPVGPTGGYSKFYGKPSKEPIGGGGADPCAVVVLRCKRGAAVFHFTPGDDPFETLGWSSLIGRTIDWKGCEAIVCGGDDTTQSNCLHDDVLAALKSVGIKVLGVSPFSSCGLNPDGTWYQT